MICLCDVNVIPLLYFVATRGERCQYSVCTSGSACLNSGVCYENALNITDKFCECTACFTGDTCEQVRMAYIMLYLYIV